MIDVVLVDDNRKLRQSVREELERHAELRVVGEADYGIAGLHLALTLHPHVVVMALAITRLDGIETTRRIKAAAPCITVIGLSVHDDERVRRAMLAAGATHLLPKETALTQPAAVVTQAHVELR